MNFLDKLTGHEQRKRAEEERRALERARIASLGRAQQSSNPAVAQRATQKLNTQQYNVAPVKMPSLYKNLTSAVGTVANNLDFNANSNYDRQARLKRGLPELYQDQQRSNGNMRPNMNAGQAFVGNTARFLNTANAAAREVQDTTKMYAAQLTNNPTAYRNAQAENYRFKNTAYQPNSGLLGAGTIFNNPGEFNTLGAKDLSKRIGATTVGTAGEVIPVGKGVQIAKAGGQISKVGTSKLIGQGALAGGMSSVGEQQIQYGRVDPKQVAAAALMGGALTGVIGVGGAKLAPNGIQLPNLPKPSKVIKSATNAVQSFDDKLVSAANPVYGALLDARKTAQRAFDVETNPRSREQINRYIAELDREIGKSKRGGINGEPMKMPEDPTKGAPIDPMAQAEKRTNQGLGELSSIRKQYANDQEFFEKVILENQDAKGEIGDFARHIARRDATEGSIYNKNYLTEILDDELAPLNTKLDQSIAKSAQRDELAKTIRDFEKSTGQTGLYKKVSEAMRGMNEQEQIDFMGKALTNMRDKGLLAADFLNKQSGYTPKAKPVVKPIDSGAPIEKTAKTPQVKQEQTPNQLLNQEPVVQSEKSSMPIASKNVVSETQNAPINLNTSKFDVNNQTKQGLEDTVKTMQADIESKVGKRLTNKEVKQYAEMTNRVLNQGKTRQSTMDEAAAYVNATERLASLQQKASNGGVISQAEQKELQKLMLNVKAKQFEIGRMMNAFKQTATPKEKQLVDVMLERLVKKGHDMDELTKELDKINLNDPKQAAEFYRKFEKGSFEDWLDKYRYTNMLSSPMTHIVNVTSNTTGVVGVAPVQKVYEGALDAVRAGITRSERTRYAGESLAYLRGAFESLGDAGVAFKSAMKGENLVGNPDIDSLRNVPLATKGFKGFADTTLSLVTKFLEASDQAMTKVAAGGELAALNKRALKGVETLNAEKVALDKATYRNFRQDLGGKEQGYLLQAIDVVPNSISKWRQSENPIIRNASKFVFPFVKTPVNLLKQGIEYTPTGILTLPGSTDKTAQLAKSAMGTTMMGVVAGVLAAGGDLTFGEPADPDERNKFRAEGKQPYAVKIGNKWFSYQKTHPAIAFNFALVAGVKEALDSKKIDDSTADTILEAGANMMQFFTDQSYMKNVGDVTSALSGKDGQSWGRAITNQLGNSAAQLVAFRGTLSWINRMIDPTQRKVDNEASFIEKIYQQATKDIPFLDESTPARLGPDGEPIKNQYPVLNNFSPVKVTEQSATSVSTTNQTTNSAKPKMTLEEAKKMQKKEFGGKYATLTEDELKELAKTDPEAAKYKKSYDATVAAYGATPDLPTNLNDSAKKVLERSSRLTSEGTAKWNKLPNNDKTIQSAITSWLPDKSRPPKITNEVAKMWAEYEKSVSEGTINKIEADSKKRSIITSAYKAELDDLTKSFYSLGDDAMKAELEKGTITQAQMDKVIEIDNILTSMGMQKYSQVGKKLRSTLGYGLVGGSSGSGGGGGRGGKPSFTSVAISKQANSPRYVTVAPVKKAVFKRKSSRKSLKKVA